MSRQPSSLVLVLACALILAAPTLLNGAPFFYFDTAEYLSQAEGAFRETATRVAALFADATPTAPAPVGAGPVAGTGPADGTSPDPVILSGRSIYYGLLAYLSYVAAQLWPLVALQCLVVAWLVVTLFRHAVPDRWALPSLLTTVALSTVTPAAFFAGFIMPDIWSGALILAVALWVAYGARLSVWSRLALLLIMIVSVLSHTSHLLLLVSLLALGALAWVASGRFRRLAGVGAGAGAVASIACGVVGSLAFSVMVERAFGQPPISRPHLSAHLVDLGPGTAYLRDSCPESGLALCAFVDRLPVDWVMFLFSADPETGVFNAATPEVQRAMAAEDLGLAVATVRSDPVRTLGLLALDGLSQLWRLSFDHVPMVEASDDFLVAHFPPDLVEMTREAGLYARPGLMPALTALTYASTLLAVVVLAATLAQRRGRLAIGGADDGRLMILLAACLAGVVLNAFVCGVLASPYGRFQARLVWILPLLAALTVTARLLPAIPHPIPQRTRTT